MSVKLIIKNADFSVNGFEPNQQIAISKQLDNAKIVHNTTLFDNNGGMRIFTYVQRSVMLIPAEYKYKDVTLVGNVTDGAYVPFVVPGGFKTLSFKTDLIDGKRCGCIAFKTDGTSMWDIGSWQDTGVTITPNIPARLKENDCVFSIHFEKFSDSDVSIDDIGLEITVTY